MKIIVNIFFVLSLLGGCKRASSSSEGVVPQTQKTESTQSTDRLQVLTGETMGTTYSIKYGGALQEGLQEAVDELLIDINNSVSTYIPSSIISTFNKVKAGEKFKLDDFPVSQQKFFMDNYSISAEIYRSSSRHFDPTVMPIVNYWGFGYDGRKKITKIDSSKVINLLSAVGMNHISHDAAVPSWTKRMDEVELDFSAVAKGYAVDQVAELFDARGLQIYYIEIGGECKAKGSKNGKPWTIGVSLPDPRASSTDIVTKIDLVNSAVATSGNYRNYYELDGQIISHTINPKTGFPERNNLLSVTVFHPDCARADALATAAMSMGYDDGFPFIDDIPEAECYMVYTSRQGQVLEAMSAGMVDLIH